MKLHFQDHARPGIVATLAALGCVAAPLAFGHGTATTTSSTQGPGYAESSVSSTSDSNAVTTTTRQSTSSSGPTVQGTSTFSNAAGASVDGTAAANDQRLMDEVISALAADPTLKGANVNVTIDNGSVTLSGTAQDSAQAARAKQVAEGVAGLGRVNSSVEAR